MADTKLILAVFVSLIVAVCSQATCLGYRCPIGKICGYQQVTCVRAPCNPQRTCMSFMDLFRRCPRTCRTRCVLPIGSGKGSCHGQPTNSDRCPDNSNPLSIGGSQVFCGRGTTHQDCPSTHFCHISPTDRFAFCCQKKKPVDTCPLVRCTSRFCFRGYKKDANGCKTCNCCPFQFCRNFCPKGFKTSSNGCRTCQCKGGSGDCPLLKCRRPFCGLRGIKKDSKGCDTCTCNNPTQCPLLRPRCPSPNCHTVRDFRGCQTCRCSPALCPLLSPCPTLKCANGRVKDNRGCDTCRCRSTHCIPRMCARPLVPCRLGMKLDSNGCPTCDCKDLVPIPVPI